MSATENIAAQSGANLGDQVELPPNVLVQCPAQGNAMVRAVTCETCEHCKGLTADRFPGSDMPLAVRHMVVCGFPINRPLIELKGKEG